VKPSIALVDIGLPKMDGYELARRLRHLDGLDEIKLVAITGYGLDSDRSRSRAAGFDHHLVKPVSLEMLQATLEKCARSTRGACERHQPT
jgi:CheY-like chemotaxis protein